MMLTEHALRELESHWAVMAIPAEVMARADTVVQARLVRAAAAGCIHIDFADQAADDELLDRIATAYEVATAAGINAVLYPSADEDSERLRAQAQAGAYRVFDYRRALPIPGATNARIFHLLHIAAVAYCGDRWAEQRRWFLEHSEESDFPAVDGTTWDHRMLYRLFECWVRLFRKKGWDDLDRISQIISLRSDQSEFEPELLRLSADNPKPMAFRLVALYHWAKATELLALYMLQGQPGAINEEQDRHFEAARDAASACGDMHLDVLLRWLHVASRRMVAGSLWSVARAVNGRTTKFIEQLTSVRGMFELLPPQRVALQQQGLLDPARRAIVVDMPTSGGKTALAEFRILQALNQLDTEDGWVAYVAPTRALVSQLTRRLRGDFGGLGINVESLSGAIEVDSYEEGLLTAVSAATSFHVLVSTPEKLQFVIRNNKTARPLGLVVLDEAQNIEDEGRGLRIELLLATIRRDRPEATFLLMMPFVPNADELATWLSPEAGTTISFGTTAWKPNERIVGMYGATKGDRRGDWHLRFETLVTSQNTVHLQGAHTVGGLRPLPVRYSDATSLSVQTAAMATEISKAGSGTSVAMGRTIADTWTMARAAKAGLSLLPGEQPEIELVQRFLAAEISPSFELIDLLSSGVAVHHAGLSDEARSLIEWLTELGKVRVLCATSTIAEGINFPVSSVFLATRFLAGMPSREMTRRDFWNLAGRTGRMEQGSVGVVGIAQGKQPAEVVAYVRDAVESLVSRLLQMLDEVERAGELANLENIIQQEQWADFRSYIAHIWNEKRNLDQVISVTEQVLRNTFGYSTLQRRTDHQSQMKAKRLLDATRNYARRISDHPENALLADATGFAPEGVQSAILGLNNLGRHLTTKEWEPESLFSSRGNRVLRDLVGVMLRIPEIRAELQKLGRHGLDERRVADLTQAWVGGESIERIAVRYFGASGDTETFTEAISATCRAIYRTLTNYGTWGIASLSKIGIKDFDKMSREERRRVNSLPAMIYYGVSSEEAILMRMHSVPRTVAQPLGRAFLDSGGSVGDPESARQARRFVRALSGSDWHRVVPAKSPMSGEDYKRIWSWLSGEETASKIV